MAVFFQGTLAWGKDFHRSASMFQKYILIYDMLVSGQQTAKKALIGIISNICYMKNRVHKWYRMSIAFLWQARCGTHPILPKLEALPILFLFSSLKWQRKVSSLSWLLLFKNLSLKFFQTSQDLHAPGQEDPPGKQACRSESSLNFGSSLIKELVLFFWKTFTVRGRIAWSTQHNSYVSQVSIFRLSWDEWHKTGPGRS